MTGLRTAAPSTGISAVKSSPWTVASTPLTVSDASASPSATDTFPVNVVVGDDV